MIFWISGPGMARVFSYKEKGPDHQPQLGEHAHDLLYFMIDGSLRNHMSMGTITLMNSRNDWFAMWGVGFYDDPAIMGGMHHENDDTEYDTGSEWGMDGGCRLSSHQAILPDHAVSLRTQI